MLTFQFTPFPELRTPRLLLRAMRDSDAPAFLVHRSDPRMMRYLDRAPDQTVAESLAMIHTLRQITADNTGITWAMVRPEQKELLLGTVCFWNLMPEHHRAELGYALHPDYWRQGLMQETLAAVLQYGFHSMRLRSVEANVDPRNAASIALLERSCFVREAHSQEHHLSGGRLPDLAAYSLLTPLREPEKIEAAL